MSYRWPSSRPPGSAHKALRGVSARSKVPVVRWYSTVTSRPSFPRHPVGFDRYLFNMEQHRYPYSQLISRTTSLARTTSTSILSLSSTSPSSGTVTPPQNEGETAVPVPYMPSLSIPVFISNTSSAQPSLPSDSATTGPDHIPATLVFSSLNLDFCCFCAFICRPLRLQTLVLLRGGQRSGWMCMTQWVVGSLRKLLA